MCEHKKFFFCNKWESQINVFPHGVLSMCNFVQFESKWEPSLSCHFVFAAYKKNDTIPMRLEKHEYHHLVVGKLSQWSLSSFYLTNFPRSGICRA